jgi:general secretion pathway protein A
LYQEFFNLKDHPFRLTPDPAFLYMTARHREALAGLVYSTCTRPGLAVLVGEAGTGKTTLLYSLIGLLEKRRFFTATCLNPTLTRVEFYDLLMLKFGISCPSGLKSRQLASLQQLLLHNFNEGRPSVLIVDEAQRLSPELLEEIRLLLNIETPREKLLQIILAGQTELLEILRRPEMRQLKQRVSCLCRLKPLAAEEEVKEYLQHRLANAGMSQQNLFLDAAIRLIFEYSRGIPRLVNSLCDSALRVGFALRSRRITVSIVEEAAQDLDLTTGIASDRSDLDPLDLASNYEQAAREVTSAVPADFHHNGDSGRNGKRSLETPAPDESYETRQRSLGFLLNLLERRR